METEITEDIGEEIIIKLKELNEILREIIRRKHEKERADPSCIGNLSDWNIKGIGGERKH